LDEVVPKATTSAARALAIDPNHPDALATLANMKQAFEWKFTEARALTDQVLAIEPNHVRALAEGSVMLATAAAEHPGPELVALINSRIAKARSIDPLNAWVMSVESLVLFFAGRLDEAIAAADRAIATDRENFTANWSRVIALAAAGREDDALNAAEEAFVIFKRHPSILAEVAAVYAQRGNVFAAEAIFHELSERARTTFVSRAVRAAVAASAGLMDDARRLLAEGIAERDAFLTFYKLPACRALRADAECTTILNEMVYIKDALH
jgi:serine/threonine-protein kinase